MFNAPDNIFLSHKIYVADKEKKMNLEERLDEIKIQYYQW